MSRTNLKRRIAALGLALALALPGAALARSGRAAAPTTWESLVLWLARLAAGLVTPADPAPPAAPYRNLAGDSGSTVDPDGRRTTRLAPATPVSTAPSESPSGTTTPTTPPA